MCEEDQQQLGSAKSAASQGQDCQQRQDWLRALSLSVVINQLLFTAGYSLTSGGFLTYFAADSGAAQKLSSMAWVLALPELVSVLAIGTPWLLPWCGDKKRVFLFCSLAARGAYLLIPLSVFQPWLAPFSVLLFGMIAGSLLQAIAFTAYLSWLSDLAPERSWGRFFAKRNIAHLSVLIFVPFLAALLRDALKANDVSDTLRMTVYAATFVAGNLLQLVSLWPLCRWPAHPPTPLPTGSGTGPGTASQSESPRMPHWPVPRSMYARVLLFSFWLAFFQGMTQTAFFMHSYRQLGLSLSLFYLLQGTMYVCQIPVTQLAGRISDQRGNRNLLMGSTFLVSLALLFWLASLNGNWLWLWGAYVLWGGFGMVNLTLQNLVLRVIPPAKNTALIAAYRFGSGLIAGLTGVAGGYWLEGALAQGSTFWGGNLSPFAAIFLISCVGRWLAPLWLLGLHEPPVKKTAESPVTRVC